MQTSYVRDRNRAGRRTSCRLRAKGTERKGWEVLTMQKGRGQGKEIALQSG